MGEKQKLLDQAIEKLDQVLKDEESGKGWGPDVTMVGVLKEARDLVEKYLNETKG